MNIFRYDCRAGSSKPMIPETETSMAQARAIFFKTFLLGLEVSIM
jgi:hypothetical protein